MNFLKSFLLAIIFVFILILVILLINPGIDFLINTFGALPVLIVLMIVLISLSTFLNLGKW